MLKHTISQPDWDDKNIAQKGFTLIELLVVILILGILAGVVVIAVSNLTDNANGAACKTEAKQLKTAVAAYRVDKKDYDAQPSAELLNTEGYMDGEPTLATLGYDADGRPVTGGC